MSPSSGDAHATVSARVLLPVVGLALIWGINWPILKMGVAEIAPLTFRAVTLPFAGLGLLAIAALRGDPLAIPRRELGRVLLLALFNVTGWNALVLFGVQHIAAGRSSILAFTMPLWSTLLSLVLVHEPLSRRKAAGVALGMVGMAILLGDDIRNVERSPLAALFIIGAAVSWAMGIVLLRKWQPPMPQTALTGWLMLLGWIPIALAAPLSASAGLAAPSARAWFAILYNIFLAGTVAHWAWFTLARTLPVVISSMSSLPVPIVGVFAGMLLLGERPGAAEWLALGFVLAGMFAVLWPGPASPRRASG